ncbi:FAD:protein FMN transferase [Sphingomonas koreensis]|uniref:FAD:protein FMN transferase n=1 Tax=Sphingomonas koreensis TaxID=93064 RepID=UPI000B1E5072|nr:FAD:protein FMN transferase [Sphingomonas koreensis]PJI87992.1 thiamine biosynthesis lipoprotein [Sphingomonas koreensis]
METFGGETMGTTWSAKIVAPPTGVQSAIEAVLATIIAQMSHWEPTSELSRINNSPPGTWHRIGPEFAQVMTTALDVAKRSNGAFDPAMGVAVDLWGFGPPGPRVGLPSEAEIEAARALCGYDAIDFDPLLLRLRLTRPVRLDLSGIAKGYAVDAVAARLKAMGCLDFLVEIGGELLGEGIQPDGQPWWVDVEAPPSLSIVPLRIALHGLAVATSGDYRRAFVAGGTAYAHTIDPHTARPVVNGTASVTVLHRDRAQADAWASALTVLGPAAGMALAERKGLAAHMLTHDGNDRLSPALLTMLA